MRGGKRLGHAARAVARQPTHGRAARMEGRDLVSLGSRAAPLPRREGLRLGNRSPARRGLGHNELLTGDDRVPTEVVALLDLPHALAWITGIRVLGDAPERVARLHDVDLLRSGPVRAVGCEPDGERRRADQYRELYEHLFA